MHDEEEVIVKDSNGNVLADGNTVLLIKDLKLKGSSTVFKRGEIIKNIRLVDDDTEHVEARVGKGTIFLRTEFIKKKPA